MRMAVSHNARLYAVSLVHHGYERDTRAASTGTTVHLHQHIHTALSHINNRSNSSSLSLCKRLARGVQANQAYTSHPHLQALHLHYPLAPLALHTRIGIRRIVTVPVTNAEAVLVNRQVTVRSIRQTVHRLSRRSARVNRHWEVSASIQT